MDAMPQRPFRAFKVRDENMPPTALPAKTIHQRNKSSPALYTLAQAGATKLGAKRTAFADVSNMSRPLPTVKDDSVITTKPGLDINREVKLQDYVKPAPLLRPAQRPLSVTGIKGFLNNLTSHASSNILKPITNESRHDHYHQPIVSSKPIVKPGLLPGKEIEVLTTKLTEKVSVAQPDIGLTIPTRQSDIEIVDAKISENIYIPAQADVKTVFEPRPDSSSFQFGKAVSDYQDVRSDGTHLYTTDPPLAYYPESHAQFDGTEIYVDAASHLLPELEPARFAEKIPLARVQENEIGLPHLLPVSELEEYWEEAGYDEEYDDVGYTTARSLKSRGDYTTGPTTIVLGPRTTANVERELAAAKQIVLQAKGTDDAEDDESWDTSMVAEYGEEIFEYMRALEERMRPNPYYMDNQTEVQWSMRSVLMDWLVQVHHRFNLLPETLFLCVNYIDRFLSCKVVSLGKLQLVGATAIFVAAKYEEINCPSVSEIIYMVDGGYTVDEILKAERFMLSMLQFELGWPGPMSFLRRISKADDYDLETRTLAKYFLEITIMDERFVGCIPSYTAAGAHCLARLMLKKGTWSPAHVYYSDYTYSQLRPLLHAMLSCCEEPQKHHAAVYDKYGDKRFKRASYFVQSEISKGFLLPVVPRSSFLGYDLGGKLR